MFVFEDTQCMAFLLLFSRSVMSDSLRPHGLQHTRLPCPSLSPRVCSNSFSLNCWCYTTILSSAAPSLFALNLFQHQGLFQQVSSSHQGGQSIGASTSASVLQWVFRVDFLIIDWFDSSLSKGPWKVFSSTTIQKHQFSGSQPSLWYNSHIHTWLLEKP